MIALAHTGDVFQINEHHDPDGSRAGWVGAFVLVDEVYDWGIRGYVHVVDTHATPAAAYIRLKWAEIVGGDECGFRRSVVTMKAQVIHSPSLPVKLAITFGVMTTYLGMMCALAFVGYAVFGTFNTVAAGVVVCLLCAGVFTLASLVAGGVIRSLYTDSMWFKR